MDPQLKKKKWNFKGSNFDMAGYSGERSSSFFAGLTRNMADEQARFEALLQGLMSEDNEVRTEYEVLSRVKIIHPSCLT